MSSSTARTSARTPLGRVRPMRPDRVLPALEYSVEASGTGDRSASRPFGWSQPTSTGSAGTEQEEIRGPGATSCWSRPGRSEALDSLSGTGVGAVPNSSPATHLGRPGTLDRVRIHLLGTGTPNPDPSAAARSGTLTLDPTRIGCWSTAVGGSPIERRKPGSTSETCVGWSSRTTTPITSATSPTSRSPASSPAPRHRCGWWSRPDRASGSPRRVSTPSTTRRVLLAATCRGDEPARDRGRSVRCFRARVVDEGPRQRWRPSWSTTVRWRRRSATASAAATQGWSRSAATRSSVQGSGSWLITQTC